jgi:hypothetical protein
MADIPKVNRSGEADLRHAATFEADLVMPQRFHAHR